MEAGSYIVQYHDIADSVIPVQTPSSIGNDNRLDAEQLHHADRECHLLDGVSFVETTL